jgi:uncharacterized membrane protein YhaH (DUF805 family)
MRQRNNNRSEFRFHRNGIRSSLCGRKRESAITFQHAIASGFQNYATFAGRAPRSEYWYWVLFALLVGAAAAILDQAFFPGLDTHPLHSLASLALFLPGLAVSVRRLHDLDRTGWWMLIMLTGIGIILLLIWFCLRGTPGPNRYGPDPLTPASITPMGDMQSPTYSPDRR